MIHRQRLRAWAGCKGTTGGTVCERRRCRLSRIHVDRATLLLGLLGNVTAPEIVSGGYTVHSGAPRSASANAMPQVRGGVESSIGPDRPGRGRTETRDYSRCSCEQRIMSERRPWADRRMS